MSLLLSVYRCLCLMLLLLVMAVQAEPLDAVLEAELDNYVLLLQQDTRAAGQKLLQLEQQHRNSPSLPSRVRLLSYLVAHQNDEGNEQAFESYLAQLLQLAQHTENPDALSEIYATEVEMLFYRQQLNNAVVKADALQVLVDKAQDPRVRYYSHNVLGRLYMADNQYEQALQHFTAALNAVIQTSNAFTLRRLAFLNFNIVRVHTELKNWPQARQLAQQLIDDVQKYQLNNFLADSYLVLGYIDGSDNNLAQAALSYQRGYEAARAYGQNDMLQMFENNLGATYIQMERFDQAREVLTAALRRAEQESDEYGQQLIKMNLGYIRVMGGEHEAGIAQMEQGMRYFSEHASKAEFEPYFEWLAKAYAAAGRYQQQAETLLEQMALRQQIRNADREDRLSQLQQRYNSKAQAQQITILEQENALSAQLLQNQRLQQQLIWLVVVIVAFAASMLFQLYCKVRRSNKKLYETNIQLAYQSQRDVLTGLYNRRALQEYLQKRALKRRDADLSRTLTGFLLLDIDFFKRINDNFGHAAGDGVLQAVAQRLQDTCRDKDMVVRWGGEEILLVLDNIEPDHVRAFTQRVLDTVAGSPVSTDGQQIAVTVSGGFIHLPFAGVSETQLDWEKVLQIADMALYLSKTNGRNQSCLVEGLNVSFAEAESQLHSDLAGAIRAGQVKVATISGPGGNVS